jgi:predicted 3-demethylubiquinone-9 3-methyltransferase (glyoxalase superfamily)
MPTREITTFLTFAERAEEPSCFVRPSSRARMCCTRRRARAKGSLMSATFELAGQTFIARNGGPSFSFAQGMPLFVSCDTQAEVDRYWERLSQGGEQAPCGWLRDKFGDQPRSVRPRVDSLRARRTLTEAAL